MMGRGVFITIEGGHGCGKSTVVHALRQRLSGLGSEVVTLTDQGGTGLGKELRRINLEAQEWTVAPLSEALLIAAARHQNVVEIIKPNLAEGRIVISERFNDGFVAFQVFGRGLALDLVERLGEMVAAGARPDLTILLDVDPQVALARLGGESIHRIEREPLDFHERVREGYLFQARRFSTRCSIVDASAGADTVALRAWELVERALNTI